MGQNGAARRKRERKRKAPGEKEREREIREDCCDWGIRGANLVHWRRHVQSGKLGASEEVNGTLDHQEKKGGVVGEVARVTDAPQMPHKLSLFSFFLLVLLDINVD